MGTQKAHKGLTAAIYTRISRDKESEEHGVKRQREDCLKLAKRLGYTVAEEDIFSDNDISASTKSTKVRPRYDAMMEQAKAEKYAAILAYSNSRLTRRPREFEDLIDLYDEHGVVFHFVASGSFDLKNADGRSMARYLANQATAESDRTAERVARAKAQNAKDGEFRGGRRPFGYEKDGLRIRQKEAAVIREAAKLVLDGASLRAVANHLTETGAPHPVSKSDKGWTYGAVRNVLLRARNIGWIAHGTPTRPDGDDYRPKFELVAKAKWDPILDEATFNALVTKLTDPSRRASENYDLTHVLSGILKCGECGAPMRHATYGSRPSDPTRKSGALYRCSQFNHRTIEATKTEAYIEYHVTQRVRDPKVIAAMNAEKADELAVDRIERERLDTKLQENLDWYTNDPDADARAYTAKRDRLNAQIKELDERITAGLSHTVSSEVFAAHDPGAVFAALRDDQLDIKRAVIRTMIAVRVLPADRRGAPWTKDRLEITNLV